MTPFIFNNMKILSFLLVGVFIIGECKAVLPIKKAAWYLTSLSDTINTGTPADTAINKHRHHFSLLPRHARIAMDRIKSRNEKIRERMKHETGSNTNGIISLSSVGVSLTAVGIAAILGFTASVA